MAELGAGSTERQLREAGVLRSGSSCLGGAAIANGTVYWGTGYGAFYPLTTPGNRLFALTPNGA